MDKPSKKQIRIWGKGIVASDKQAFNNLFRALYPPLIRFARTYNRDEATARDIVQEAFVALWEERRQLEPNRSIKAYLYRIVRNKSLNYLRDHADENIGLSRTLSLEAAAPVGEEPSNADELLDLLEQWVEQLPARQREAFELSRFEGLSHEEIAGVMEVSSNTVNNHIVAALSFLRDCYDEYQNKQVNDRSL